MKGCDFMKRILRCGLLVALFTFQLICCSNISSNTFTTHKDELLGPIVIYLDKNNLNVLGLDFRE